jgi:predicted permease
MASIKTLFKDVLSNPIVLAILAGSVWRFAGAGLHAVPDKIITMLSQGAIPAALFALGLSLTKFTFRSSGGATLVLMVLKLIAMPLAAALLAFRVFDLAPVEAGVVVLFAAMPTGANAYIYAERHNGAGAAVSASVAAGTALSLVTLSIVLALLPNG